jgi:UDP-N-acetylmuramoyl-tripeptide--D-alanyl-D-alanine ligase
VSGFFQGLAGLADVLGGRAVGEDPGGAPVAYDIDSRRVGAGGLFFALPGARVDGHDFLPAMAEAGAWGAVVSDASAAEAAGVPAVVVEDVAAALYRAAEARRATLEYPMIGVTGTNGKTSTKDLIAKLLGMHRKVAVTRGNFNNLLGLPISLLNAPADADVGVFELGMSTPGEIDRLAALLRPRYGVITNVSMAHIDGLGSLEAVRAAKGELIPHIARDGILYLNADDPSSKHFARVAEGREVRAVTTRGVLGAACHFQVERVDLEGITGQVVLDFVKEGRQLRRRIRWPIPGRHLVYPLLFGLLLSQDLGIPVDLEGWEESPPGDLAPTGGRMRPRPAGEAWVVDDSYNANPASLEAALDFLRELEVAGKRYAVLGDMLELGDYAGPCHRAIVERVGADPNLAGVWLVGELFEAAAAEVDDLPGSVVVTMDRDRAAAELAERLGRDDLVLVKGSRGIGLDAVVDKLCEEAPCS